MSAEAARDRAARRARNRWAAEAPAACTPYTARPGRECARDRHGADRLRSSADRDDERVELRRARAGSRARRSPRPRSRPGRSSSGPCAGPARAAAARPRRAPRRSRVPLRRAPRRSRASPRSSRDCCRAARRSSTGIPRRAPAYATPRPWLPRVAVTTPRRRALLGQPRHHRERVADLEGVRRGVVLVLDPDVDAVTDGGVERRDSTARASPRRGGECRFSARGRRRTRSASATDARRLPSSVKVSARRDAAQAKKEGRARRPAA